MLAGFEGVASLLPLEASAEPRDGDHPHRRVSIATPAEFAPPAAEGQ